MSLKIDLTKIDEKIVDKYLALYGISVRGGLNAKVNALEKHQRPVKDGGTVPDSDVSAACTKCGAESDFKLPECPFCGDKNEDDVPTETAEPRVVSEEPGPEMTDEDPLGTEETTPTEPPETTGTFALDSKPSEDEPSQDEPEEDEQPVVPAQSTPPPAPEPEVTVDEQPAAAAEEEAMKTQKGQKLTRVSRKASVVDTSGHELAPSAKELDDAIERFNTALKSGATSYWDIGRALIDIHDKQLWKQRIEGGKQKYSSWNLFCRDELHMSHVNAFSVMDASRYFSRKDFEEVGHSKLQMMLRLPEETRKQLIEEAKQGKLPRARLKQILEERPNKGARDTGRTSHARNKDLGKAATSGAKANAEKAAAKRKVLPAPSGELTAVSQLGRATIKLYARPNVKKPTEKPHRAVSVTEDPWGEEKLVNGVVVRYTVIKTPNGLELKIERKRAE